MIRSGEHGSSGRGAREPGRLRQLLRQIDGAPYPRYRQIIGCHPIEEFVVHVDRVPPDPFAGRACIRLTLDRSSAGLPDALVVDRHRRMAVEDWVCRTTVARLASQLGGPSRHAPGRAAVAIDAPGPAVIERSGCRITDSHVELRLLVDLPARGRRVRGLEAWELFGTRLVRLGTSVLIFSSRAIDQARGAADNVDDHRALQQELAARGLVAFVGDGSILPRAAGDDPRPLDDGSQLPFETPGELAATVRLPHRGEVRGMGIPGGVTLIVGGAFHGKSTLLEAIAGGVHPRRVGDGRELVATRAEALSIRAEDGRSVQATDISCFLGRLPSGGSTREFSTSKASGSTSQAAAIVEGLELGAGPLLMDEDRCATNFMIRDGRMQRLLPRPAEPLVPFIDRVRELYERFGVSTIIVTGGSGDYLEVADTVIQMDHYRAREVGEQAREVVARTRTQRLVEELESWHPASGRVADARAIARSTRLRPRPVGARGIRAGEEVIDLTALEQLADVAQVRALARLLTRAVSRMRPDLPLARLVAEVDAWIEREGIDAVDAPVSYDLARPRPLELAAVLNRWRALRFTAEASP